MLHRCRSASAARVRPTGRLLPCALVCLLQIGATSGTGSLAAQEREGVVAEEEAGHAHEHEHHSHDVETFSHTVTVTGSWIPGTPEDAAPPVSVLSRDDLEAEGSPGMLGLIRNLSFSSGADVASHQFATRAGADRSTLNLRGLGPSRSLVLLNGDRLGGGVSDPDSPLCRFQFTAFDNLVQDTRRGQWFTEASWDTEGGWHIGGEYLLAGADVPSWQTSPSYPPTRIFDPTRSLRANNPGLIDMARRYPEFYGPYAFCGAPYCDWQGDGGTQDAAGLHPAWQEVAWIRGRMFGQEGPLRGHIRESETERFAFDLEGVTSETLWAFRASWSTAVRTFKDSDALDYRVRRSLAGLGGSGCEQQVPNEYDASGNLRFSLGTLHRHAGKGECRYWIPFSNSMKPHALVPGALNPDYDPAFDNAPLEDYLTTILGHRGETSLVVLEAVASSLLDWEFAGGAAEYAVGAQWRSETYELRPYSLGAPTPRGGALHDLGIYPCPGGPDVVSCEDPDGVFIYLPPSFPMEDDRGIGSLFGELSLPLLQSVESQFSLRFEDYGGDVGSSLDPKVALRWQANDSLAVRGSFGTTFRGPTLNQTVSGIADATRSNIDRIGTAKPIRIQGDPALDPESARTLNTGLVFERSGLSRGSGRFFATLDYWRYEFTDPLVIQPFSALIDLACPPANHPICDPATAWFDALTISGGVPSLENLDTLSVRIVNGPDIDTDGIDFRADFDGAAGKGRLSLGASGTYTLSWRIDAWELGEAYDAKGRLNHQTSLARPVPRFKGRLFAAYTVGAFTGRLFLNHTDSNVHDAPPPWGQDYPIEAHTTHDVHVSWSLPGDRAMLFASIVNLADRNPPRVFQIANYDPWTHDPLGRVLSIGLRFEF